MKEYPKIDIDKVVDRKKIVVDENDKVRIKKNCELLKSQNIEVFESMVFVPRNFDTFLKDEKYYVSKMLKDYLFAVMAASMTGNLKDDERMFLQIMETFENKFAVNEIINDTDYGILVAISKGEMSPRVKNIITWGYEKVAVYLNMLGLKDNLQFGKNSDYRAMDDYFYFDDDINMQYFLKNAKLKSKEEILEKADLAFRYGWAAEEAVIKGDNFKLNHTVLIKQKEAFAELLNWNEESLLKNALPEK